jgi:hypothetical protein
MGKLPDDKDAAQEMARDLADIALGSSPPLKGEADAWLRDPNYGTP